MTSWPGLDRARRSNGGVDSPGHGGQHPHGLPLTRQPPSLSRFVRGFASRRGHVPSTDAFLLPEPRRGRAISIQGRFFRLPGPPGRANSIHGRLFPLPGPPRPCKIHPRTTLPAARAAGPCTFHPRTTFGLRSCGSATSTERLAPLDRRLPSRRRQAAIAKGVPDVLQRLLRPIEDTFSRDQDEAPAQRLQPRPPADVLVPLHRVLGMLTSLVLDGQQDPPIGQLDPGVPASRLRPAG